MVVCDVVVVLGWRAEGSLARKPNKPRKSVTVGDRSGIPSGRRSKPVR